MIIWISGNTGSGKSFLADLLIPHLKDFIHLDGDDMRMIWTDMTFSERDRREHNHRIARLAKLLSKSRNVIVTVIAPYVKLREEIDEICNPVWIYMPSVSSEDKPYEQPTPRT